MERVRAAFIGVGARGSGHVATMMSLEGVEIVAIADNYEPSLKASLANVKSAGRKEPAAYGRGDRGLQADAPARRHRHRDHRHPLGVAHADVRRRDARRQACLYRSARRRDPRRVLAVGRNVREDAENTA